MVRQLRTTQQYLSFHYRKVGALKDLTNPQKHRSLRVVKFLMRESSGTKQRVTSNPRIEGLDDDEMVV